jgi:hypothetical protein
MHHVTALARPVWLDSESGRVSRGHLFCQVGVSAASAAGQGVSSGHRVGRSIWSLSSELSDQMCRTEHRDRRPAFE